jgi:hypothetical protein
MDQNIQQATESKLPIKTKVAAWLAIIYEAGGMTDILYSLFRQQGPERGLGQAMYVIILFFVGIFIIPPIFLLKVRKKWVWTLNIASLIFCISFCFIGILLSKIFPSRQSILSYLLIFTSLILLLLDRKNFWKVAK